MKKDLHFTDKCADESLIYKDRAQSQKTTQNAKVQKTCVSTNIVVSKRFLC